MKNTLRSTHPKLYPWLVWPGLIIVVAVIAWISQQYHVRYDLSLNQRNSVSPETTKLLTRLAGPIKITAFLANDSAPELHKDLQFLVDRYQYIKPDIRLNILRMAHEPELAKQLDIHPQGEILVDYQDRVEKMQQFNEQTFTNALLRLAASGERWIVFAEGHGERSAHRQGNLDLSQFARSLQLLGMKVQSLDLNLDTAIPDNTDVLVLTTPKVALSQAALQRILDYLDQGGNLLWLADAGEPFGLTKIAQALGVVMLPGTILSAASPNVGIRNPAFIVIHDYDRESAVTRGFQRPTLFSFVTAMETLPSAWQPRAIITTDDKTWTETGPLDKPPLQYDPKSQERRGPLVIALTLTRTPLTSDASTTGESSLSQQRVVVVGDGDFLSNALLANAGNSDLGLNLIHWLTYQDRFIDIQPKTHKDVDLSVNSMHMFLFRFGFPVVLPIIFLTLGLLIRYRRHQA